MNKPIFSIPKKRVLKLVCYPQHAKKLAEIALHYKVSSSLALQIVLAYQVNIFTCKKNLKRFQEIESANHVWLLFDKESDKSIHQRLTEEEITYTDFCKRRISEFYEVFKKHGIDHNNESFDIYLPKKLI